MEPRIEPRQGLFADLVAAGAKKSFGREMKSARVFANHPRMMFGFMRFNRAAEHTPHVPKPLAELAVLRAATMVGCPFCIDIASEYSRRAGLSDEQLLSLNDAHGCGLFDADQLLVIDLATGMTITPGQVDDELMERVKARFGVKGTMELVQLIAWENHALPAERRPRHRRRGLLRRGRPARCPTRRRASTPCRSRTGT